MSVGLLIISHGGIGATLLGSATLMLGDCPLQASLLSVERDSEPEQLTADVREQIARLDEGDGVLILSDLYGSTPDNVAKHAAADANAQVVSGVNLPMLIRVLNYPELPLNEMAAKAVSGGKDGIFAPSPEADHAK